MSADPQVDRGRCVTCRWWQTYTPDATGGDCKNPLVLDREDPAHRGVVAPHGRFVTYRNYGCVHWSGENCPTCGVPARASA